MIIACCAYLAGTLALLCLPELPPAYSYAALCVAPLALRWRAARVPAFFLIGFFWAAWHAHVTLDHVIDAKLEGRTVLVQGVIADIPAGTPTRALRLLVHAERLNAGGGWMDFRRTLRLGWYRTREQPALGERWQLAVRLKRPHGYANPGGFDFERWLFQQDISATGYVRDDGRNRLLGPGSRWFTDGFRHTVADYFHRQVDPSPGLALIRALTIGDDSDIGVEQWDVLRATGTTHLMVISGTHISLVAGLVFWLTRRLWTRLGGLPEALPAARAAGVSALLVATWYALLTGLGIPSRRALIMLAVGIAALLAGRWSRPAQVLALAAIATLVVDPQAVLASGWWLSFWAVTMIVTVTAGRFGRAGFWRGLTRVHVVLAVGMLPLLLLFYQQASLVAPVANLIAVPWVSLLVVPTALLGTVLLSISTTVGGWLLHLAADFMDLLWPVLSWLAGREASLLSLPQPPTWTLPPALAGLLLLFAPRGLPGRWPGLVLLLPMLAARSPAPDSGAAWITLLDVGQGLSTVVRTRDHTLVYDAGPAYGPEFDTGRAVLVPYLRSQGMRRIDMLVVSHGDNDHIGGVASLLQEYATREVRAGIPDRVTMRKARQCRKGERWHWDGVDFAVLHPDADSYRKGNNSSCVIRIETEGGWRALLTGDIEAESERRLLRDSSGHLSADALVVPHHGSLTSSSAAFVKAVQPGYALFSTGYRNRFHFPAKTVEARYSKSGSVLFDTAVHGALTVRLGADGRPPEVEAYRCAERRYWRAAVCGADAMFGCCHE